MKGDELALAVARRKRDQDARNQPRDDPYPQADPGVAVVAAGQRPVCAHGRDDERRCYHGRGHVMQVLPERPGIAEEGA